MRAAGIDAAVLTGESMDGDYWIGSVPDLSNFYVVNYGSKYGDDPNADVNAFFERFEKKFGKKADVSWLARLFGGPGLGAGREQGGLARRRQGGSRARHVRQGAAGDRADDLDVRGHIETTRPMAIIGVDKGKFAAEGRLHGRKIPEILTGSAREPQRLSAWTWQPSI